MKRTIVVKMLSVFLSVVMILVFVTYDSFAAETVSETEDSPSAAWKDKIDPVLFDKMKSNNDRIPVRLWLEDIEYSVFTDEVYLRTGLTEDNLSVNYETFSEDLALNVAKMESLDDNSKKEVADDLKSYLDKTKSSREIEFVRTDTYITELRNVQKEMYPEHNGAAVVVGANFANSGAASLSGTIKISSLGQK